MKVMLSNFKIQRGRYLMLGYRINRLLAADLER